MQQQRQGNSNRTMRAHTVLQSWHKLSFKRTVSTSLIGPLSSRLKSVWAFVKRAGETCAQKPVSISDPAKTWESTGRKWQNIPQMTIRSVCQSMIRLLRAVIKAKKYRTWYQWPKPHFDVSLLTSISIIASFLIKAYSPENDTEKYHALRFWSPSVYFIRNWKWPNDKSSKTTHDHGQTQIVKGHLCDSDDLK